MALPRVSLDEGDARDLQQDGVGSPGASRRCGDRLFISYHGTLSSGIDLLLAGDTGLRRCGAPATPNYGCVRGHGDIKWYAGGLLAATGTEQVEEPTHLQRGLRQEAGYLR